MPPRPDSPSVFGALLDRTAGTFRFGPTNIQVPHQRRYVPGTMVLETTWHTPTGWLVVNDFLVIHPVDNSERRPGYRRAPSGAAATGTLVRTATCVGGAVEVLVNAVPLFDYGLTAGLWSYEGDGYQSTTVRAEDGEFPLRLVSSLPLGVWERVLMAGPPWSRARPASWRCRGATTRRPRMRRPPRIWIGRSSTGGAG